jgi:hypothetical protein
MSMRTTFTIVKWPSLFKSGPKLTQSYIRSLIYNMENVRHIVVPIVPQAFHEKIFYLYVSFLSPLPLK